MTPIEHIANVQAIELGAIADTALAGDLVLSAGMVDIDMSFVFMLGLFLVFAVLMHYLVLKPLIISQEARFKGMGGAREDASSYELRAAQMRLDYERRIQKARQDAVQIRDTIKKDASGIAQERVAATNDATNRQIEGAKAELGKFATAARTEMKTHADALATELSTKMIGGKA